MGAVLRFLHHTVGNIRHCEKYALHSKTAQIMLLCKDPARPKNGQCISEPDVYLVFRGKSKDVLCAVLQVRSPRLHTVQSKAPGEDLTGSSTLGILQKDLNASLSGIDYRMHSTREEIHDPLNVQPAEKHSFFLADRTRAEKSDRLFYLTLRGAQKSVRVVLKVGRRSEGQLFQVLQTAYIPGSNPGRLIESAVKWALFRDQLYGFLQLPQPVCIKKLIGYWTVAGIGYGPEFSLL